MDNPFEVILNRLNEIDAKICALASANIIPEHVPEMGYLSRKEVAERYRITTKTLGEWTKTGRLKGYRIGRRVLYKPNEIDAALAAIKTK